ncbi:ABC transporter ATP-binding protein [Mediterraneibacter sp. NSJ-55]|uniref:ABC transporter ATP-binding protein n=1 Tax=Mediterraneibacter hominis TaxID=2763054 RepID=A0A923LIU9_9FIRM|nr:ABC transporter ATP-binding protein [Mediterraneibacter hominis]MBC5689108.1 ABC transporter ATP-binding protein [Mediterraneibacter hominis]
MQLSVKDLDYIIEGTKVLDAVSLCVEEGGFVGLIGPNGCGKSTLLKNIYKTYKPERNAVFISGKDVMEMPPKEMAGEVSVVAQENNVEFDVEVLDMVMYGRYAHRRFLEGEKKEDIELCRQFLREVGMEGYEHRMYLSLSGGEKQRVLLARALTQQSRLIVLDEPTNHLDVRYQYLIMQTLKKQKITVFSSIHDLNIASMYCDKIILMDRGRIVAVGRPEEIITEKYMQEVFGVRSQIKVNEITGKIQIYYLSDNCKDC